MKTKLFSSIAILSIILAGCAKSTKDIPAQYISPIQYDSYSCKQVEAEMQNISRRVTEVGGQVDKTASDDAAQTAVGIVLFWPALFLLDPNNPQAVEYARLKGEFDALEKSSIQKNCGIKIEKPVVVPTAAPKAEKAAYPSAKR